MSERLTNTLNPFSGLSAVGCETPAQLREENESLKKIIAFQDERILSLVTERVDLHRLLGLRGETVDLEQRIEERKE
jgi:hypothetical protein